MQFPPRGFRAVAPWFLCGLVATCAPVMALPLYHANANGGEGPVDGSSNFPVSRGSMASGGGNEINAFAAAGQGSLRADTNVRFLQDTPGAGGRLTASAFADMTLDDVIITGPAGPITTKYKVHLSGILQASASSSVPGGASSLSTVEVQLQANGGPLLVDDAATIHSGSPVGGSGQLLGFNGGADLVTPSFSVTANQPFNVVVRLLILSQADMSGSPNTGLAEASSHFGDTLTFAPSGPVFDLPPGYTANSVGGGIVNNQFVNAPEPSLIVALPALLVFWRRPRSVAGGWSRRAIH